MIQAVKPGGEICTVIDEGLLNTEQAAGLRAYIMEHMTIKGIVRLPDVTFKPNKINVKSSILHLIKRMAPNPDLDDEYPVFFLDIQTMGYHGSGEPIRNFDFRAVVDQIAVEYYGPERKEMDASQKGDYWRWYTRSSEELASDPTRRFDFKYWDPELTGPLKNLELSGAETVKSLNSTKTKRGKSPSAALYVDESDGYALVIKAGTNVTKQGTVLAEGDFIEKNVFDEMSSVHVQDGDILLSSTGDGTLGKCAVFRGNTPAIFDGHVTLIRVNQAKVYPEYVCDYLRAGFGAAQVGRLFTGSTGLIELPADQVDRIRIPLPELKVQQSLSRDLRKAEAAYGVSLDDARELLEKASEAFRKDWLTSSN
jgi:type I restriction enzyme M protein